MGDLLVLYQQIFTNGYSICTLTTDSVNIAIVTLVLEYYSDLSCNVTLGLTLHCWWMMIHPA